MKTAWARHSSEYQLVVKQFGPDWWQYHIVRPGTDFIEGSWSWVNGFKTRRKAIKAGRKALAHRLESDRLFKSAEWEVVR